MGFARVIWILTVNENPGPFPQGLEVLTKKIVPAPNILLNPPDTVSGIDWASN